MSTYFFKITSLFLLLKNLIFVRLDSILNIEVIDLNQNIQLFIHNLASEYEMGDSTKINEAYIKLRDNLTNCNDDEILESISYAHQGLMAISDSKKQGHYNQVISGMISMLKGDEARLKLAEEFHSFALANWTEKVDKAFWAAENRDLCLQAITKDSLLKEFAKKNDMEDFIAHFCYKEDETIKSYLNSIFPKYDYNLASKIKDETYLDSYLLKIFESDEIKKNNDFYGALLNFLENPQYRIVISDEVRISCIEELSKIVLKESEIKDNLLRVGELLIPQALGFAESGLRVACLIAPLERDFEKIDWFNNCKQFYVSGKLYFLNSIALTLNNINDPKALEELYNNNRDFINQKIYNNNTALAASDMEYKMKQASARYEVIQQRQVQRVKEKEEKQRTQNIQQSSNDFSSSCIDVAAAKIEELEKLGIVLSPEQKEMLRKNIAQSQKQIKLEDRKEDLEHFKSRANDRVQSQDKAIQEHKELGAIREARGHQIDEMLFNEQQQANERAITGEKLANALSELENLNIDITLDQQNLRKAADIDREFYDNKYEKIPSIEEQKLGVEQFNDTLAMNPEVRKMMQEYYDDDLSEKEGFSR